MKRFILFLALIFIGQLVNAQIKFGLRGGLNSSTFKINEIIQADNSDSLKFTAGNAKVGFHLGLIGRIEIMSLYIQPELLFSSTGSQVKVKNLFDGSTSFQDQKFKKIDIPIMLGWKLGEDIFAFRVQAGPIASVMLSSDSFLDNIKNITPSSDFKKATWGYQAGIGIDLLEKFAIDLKYEGGLSKLGGGVVIAGQTRTFDSRANQWVLSLGFFF